MTQDNLKPCPFCGASAEIEDFSTSYRPNARPLWAVACTNNACLSEAMRALEDREAVVTAWNTRTIERLSPPPKAKPRRKKEGPCGCDVDPFGCERHPS